MNLVATRALVAAGLGWLVWWFGMFAEYDTGLPDGTACTGQTGDAYDTCMRRSEIGGLGAWAVTLGLAALGLSMLIRSRHRQRTTNGQRAWTALATLASASLAVAGLGVWTKGAGGGYYDNALGPTWWNTIMTIGLVVGAVIGWLIPIRQEPTTPPPVSLTASEPTPANGSRRAFPIALGVIAALVVLAGLVLFTAGETLFGTDPDAIDSYNEEVLETCDVPPDSTLVRTYVLPIVSDSGRHLRSMSYIYASPLPADEVAAFYEVEGPGLWSVVPDDRACRFDNRPSVWVLSRWTLEQGTIIDPVTETAGPQADPPDEFWEKAGAEVTDIVGVPADTRSFVLLRLAQREREGLFGQGPFD